MLRLKRRLGLTSNQFIEAYTIQHVGPQTGLPVIAFRTDQGLNLNCPFVTKSGCRVYEDRPSSCRMYPILRVISRSRETAKISEHFALLKESHCLGHEQGKEQTVGSWFEEQGLSPYNRHNDMLMEIIALKNRTYAGPLDFESRQKFHLALYDLDNFRVHVFEKNLLQGFVVASSDLDKAEKDETALLRLGHRWLKETLFK